MNTAAVSESLVSRRVDVRAAASALAILSRDPDRLDQVLRLGEAVNRPAFPRILASFEESADGRRLLAERPHIDEAHVDYGALAALPDGTLGREYARFLRDNGITPTAFRDPPKAMSPLHAFLAMRMRQTHDLWHVVTGCKPDIEGELLLQAFTYAQTRAPLSLLLVVGGTLRHGLRYRGIFAGLLRAYRAGKAAARFAPLPWESLWGERVSDLRARFGVPAAGIAARPADGA